MMGQPNPMMMAMMPQMSPQMMNNPGFLSMMQDPNSQKKDMGQNNQQPNNLNNGQNINKTLPFYNQAQQQQKNSQQQQLQQKNDNNNVKKNDKPEGSFQQNMPQMPQNMPQNMGQNMGQNMPQMMPSIIFFNI